MLDIIKMIMQPGVLIVGLIALVWLMGGADFIFKNPLIIVFAGLGFVVMKVLSK